MRAWIGYVGLALLVAWLVAYAIGCAALGPAGAMVSVAEYKAALDECRTEGKRRKSYAVYEQCAREADIRYGLDGGAP
jgi:hypothetical protein